MAHRLPPLPPPVRCASPPAAVHDTYHWARPSTQTVGTGGITCTARAPRDTLEQSMGKRSFLDSLVVPCADCLERSQPAQCVVCSKYLCSDCLANHTIKTRLYQNRTGSSL